ncbi:MAG: phosphopantetheine-binding protein [Bacteriovoracaceae bacterium]
MDQLFEDIAQILKQDCFIETPIKYETKIQELELDSIALLTLISSIENKHKIILDETLFEPRPETINDFIQLITLAKTNQ